jgi:formamidopyrimidine-DNA glycosylase
MSGQLLLQTPETTPSRHTHASFRFADEGPELRFVDQRTFGGLYLDDLESAVSPARAASSGSSSRAGSSGSSGSDDSSARVPHSIAHIGLDPFDPSYSIDSAIARIRQKRSGIKRVLLDQTVVSGVGNIYADESLWRARLHPEREAALLRPASLRTLLDCVHEVMSDALSVGGTSFDALYVNVNGESGYFARDLDAYGREGQECHRCGTAIRRETFMNRSSFFCPRCQRRA